MNCPKCGADLTPMFRAMGSKGGKAAKGEKKRRDIKHYRRMGRLSGERRKTGE